MAANQYMRNSLNRFIVLYYLIYFVYFAPMCDCDGQSGLPAGWEEATKCKTMWWENQEVWSRSSTKLTLICVNPAAADAPVFNTGASAAPGMTYGSLKFLLRFYFEHGVYDIRFSQLQMTSVIFWSRGPCKCGLLYLDDMTFLV